MEWGAILGPNKYLQAIAIAITFIAVGKVVGWLLRGIVGRLTNRSKTDLDDRLVDLLHRPVFLTFGLIGLAMATRRLELGNSPEFVTLGLLRTMAVFIWYGTLHQMTTTLVQSAKRRSNSKLVQTGMLQLLQNAIKIFLFALAIYFIFLAWDINVTAWVASAGIVGLALSFAARDSLSNVFAGISIVMDAPYKTGDFIILDSGERGVVTMIGLRSTRLLTRDDVEITIPNGLIGNSKIINEAGGPSKKHRIRIAVSVAYGSDIDHVIATLEQVAADNSEISKSPEARVRFRNFGESSIDFELLCWIDQPVDRGRLNHELNCAVYKAFAANKIVIPFPTRELRIQSMPPFAEKS
jgi:small-conductance mechanosensitive channel